MRKVTTEVEERQGNGDRMRQLRGRWKLESGRKVEVWRWRGDEVVFGREGTMGMVWACVAGGNVKFFSGSSDASRRVLACR